MQVRKKASVLEIIKAFIPLTLMLVCIVIFMVFMTKWANNRARINDEKSKARYEELINKPASPSSSGTSTTSTSDYVENHGTDECTSDCSGHDAGYEYAEENEICDTEYADGNSDSFNEGVVAWAEDNC